MGDSDNLPVLHDLEKAEGGAQRLETQLRQLDGEMGVSNALIPYEAYDVGDVPVKENPRPEDLGYAVGGYCHVEKEAGRVVFCDGPNAVLAGETFVQASEDDVIDDVTEWA